MSRESGGTLLDTYSIKYDELKPGESIGEGSFGTVYKGTLRGETTVARGKTRAQERSGAGSRKRRRGKEAEAALSAGAGCDEDSTTTSGGRGYGYGRLLGCWRGGRRARNGCCDKRKARMKYLEGGWYAARVSMLLREEQQGRGTKSSA